MVEEIKAIPQEMWLKWFSAIIGFLMLIMVGLLTWTVFTTHDLSVKVAVIESRTVNFEPGLTNQRLDRLEQWTTNLSNRLAEVENDLRDSN